MFFTARKLLALLDSSSLLAGDRGLDNIIKNAFPSDRGDADVWCNGGDLMITNGFFWAQNPQNLADLIGRLRTKGCVAMLLKDELFENGVVPDVVLAAANAAAIPLISLPQSTRYADILKLIIENVVAAEAAQRLQTSQLYDILLNSAPTDSSMKFFASQGLTENISVGLLSFSTRNGDSNLLSLFSGVSSVLERQLCPFSSGIIYGKLAFLIADDSGLKQKRCRTAAKLAIEFLEGFDVEKVTFSFGSPKASLSNIHESYQEALRAEAINKCDKATTQVLFWDDLGAKALLSQIKSPAAVQQYVLRYLGPLLECDHTSGTDLVSTLESIIANDWNLKAAAETTFLHYNTIRYRYFRVLELLGTDRLEREDKFNLELAILLSHLYKLD